MIGGDYGEDGECGEENDDGGMKEVTDGLVETGVIIPG